MLLHHYLVLLYFAVTLNWYAMLLPLHCYHHAVTFTVLLLQYCHNVIITLLYHIVIIMLLQLHCCVFTLLFGCYMLLCSCHIVLL